MRRVRLAVLALTAAFAVASARAETGQADGAPTDGRVRLDYAVYFGGFSVLELGVEVGVALQTYDVRTQIETVGVAGFFAPWKQIATSEGAFAGARVEPRRHRADGEFRGRHRSVAIDFADGMAATVTVQPPPEDVDRDAVPPDLRRGAVDPPSALLAVARLVAQGRGCNGRLPVFDGRRRYDVVVADGGVEALAASGYNAFQGPAVRCDFRFEPIAGPDMPRGAEAEQRKRRFRTGRAWLAELIPGKPVVPVRIEINGDLAQTMVHLRELPRGPAADN